LSTELGERDGGIFESTLLDEVSRGVWEEEETDTENESPGKLNGDGDSVGTSVLALFGGVNDDGSQHDTDGDTELVTSNESTSNLSWTDFAHVENDNGRLKADTNTGNETTSDNDAESITNTSDHLDYDTDEVDNAAHDDGPFAAHHISQITGDDGAEESTSREDRDDQRLVGRRQLGSIGAFDGLDEDGGAIDTVDIAGVVTEEDTTKGGKGADEVGLPGDGGFNGIDIFGGAKGHRVASRSTGGFLGVHDCG